MTRYEFNNKKKALKPIHNGLNLIVIFSIITWIGSIFWLIWGGGGTAWKMFFTAIVAFVIAIALYAATCFKYYEKGAEEKLIDPPPRRNRPDEQTNNGDYNDNIFTFR